MVASWGVGFAREVSCLFLLWCGLLFVVHYMSISLVRDRGLLSLVITVRQWYTDRGIRPRCVGGYGGVRLRSSL
jgi:hypothetical protein